jgi:transcriptional regulator with XRE-family HTH domain
MAAMALSRDEMATRIKAARLLRGMSQQDLAERLVEDGLAYRVAGALERGATESRPVHLHALSQVLGFPERWFTDPVDDLCKERPSEIEDRITQIEQHINDRGELLNRLEAKLDEMLRRLP